MSDSFIRTPPLTMFNVVNHRYTLSEWPPPEVIAFIEGKTSLESALAFDLDDPALHSPEFLENFTFIRLRRVSYSKLTDDKLKAMDHVARGAEYVYDTPEALAEYELRYPTEARRDGATT